MCPPIQSGSDFFVSFTRYAPPGRQRGQGFVFRSANLQSERDPEKIHWEMLPPGDREIRAREVDIDNAGRTHRHTACQRRSLLYLADVEGSTCQSYSRDGGRTWENAGPATFLPEGRPIKNPLACCRPFRTSDGRYLCGFTTPDRSRGPASIGPRRGVAGGWPGKGWRHSLVAAGGLALWIRPSCQWSGHELSGFHRGRRQVLGNVSTTRRTPGSSRSTPCFWKGCGTRASREIASGRLDSGMGLGRGGRRAVAAAASLPGLLHGGFTVNFTVQLADLKPGQVLLDWRSESGAGCPFHRRKRRLAHQVE